MALEQDLAEEVDETLTAMDEAGVSQETEQPAAADSSTATDANKPEGEEDLLSVVRDVVDKRKTDPALAASSANSDEDGQKPGDKTQKAGGAEDYSDVPFNKHPRFQEVLGKLKTAETDAIRYRNVQGFLDREGLSGEEAATGLTLLARAKNEGLNGEELQDGLSIMALSKTNPVEALARAKPWITNLLLAAGEVLPEDLKARVAGGEINRETAIEMSRQRAQLSSHKVRETFQEQQAEARRLRDVERQQGEQVTALKSTAQIWEDDRRLKDPDFEAKLPAIVAEVQKLQEMGWKPTSPDGVKEQLRRAYAAVNASLRPRTVQPAPKPALRPVMGGQAAGNVRSTGNEDMDLVNSVLSRRRAG